MTETRMMTGMQTGTGWRRAGPCQCARSFVNCAAVDAAAEIFVTRGPRSRSNTTTPRREARADSSGLLLPVFYRVCWMYDVRDRLAWTLCAESVAGSGTL
jgi:hypothetical protein